MTLLDPPAEPQGKRNAGKFTLIAVVLAAIIGGWFLFRYYPEKRAVNHFFDALVAGDTNRAYQLWKPSQVTELEIFWPTGGPKDITAL